MLRAYATFLASAPVRRLICLRSRFYDWLFGTPTQVLEVINVSFLVSWAIALWDDRLIGLPMYVGVARIATHTWANEALSMVFLLAAVFAVAGWVHKGCRSDALSGFALQIGAVMWAAVSLNYWASYPPINTGQLTYGFTGLFCWISGSYLWERGREGRGDNE